MPKLATYSTPILSNKLSAALGQRRHVQQVYLSGTFPSRAAFVRAAKEQLAGVLEEGLPTSRIASTDARGDEAAATLFITPKDTVTVGTERVRASDLLALVP